MLQYLCVCCGQMSHRQLVVCVCRYNCLVMLCMDQCEIRLVGCTLELRFRWLSQCCDVCAVAKDRLVEYEKLW